MIPIRFTIRTNTQKCYEIIRSNKTTGEVWSDLFNDGDIFETKHIVWTLENEILSIELS